MRGTGSSRGLHRTPAASRRGAAPAGARARCTCPRGSAGGPRGPRPRRRGRGAARGRTPSRRRWRGRTSRPPATSAPRRCRRPGARAARRCRPRRSGRSARMRIRSASFSASSRSCVVSRIVVLLEVGQAVDEVVELAPRVRVEAGGRLVEEEQLGPADDAHRHVEPPPLAARQGRDLAGRRPRSSPTISSSSSTVDRPRAPPAWSRARSSRRAGSADDRGVQRGWSRQDWSTTPIRARQSSPARGRVLAEHLDVARPSGCGSPRGSRSSSSCRRRWGRAGRPPRRGDLEVDPASTSRVAVAHAQVADRNDRVRHSRNATYAADVRQATLKPALCGAHVPFRVCRHADGT